MRTLLVMTLLAGEFSLRADFSYKSKTQLTGGTLFNAALAMGPAAREATKPVVTTHLIKGNRMATLTKDHTTVVNLDNETILEIDFSKKTYFSLTFTQMKQVLDQAMKEAIAGRSKSSDGTFQVASKSTGRTRSIGVMNAKEMVVTMTIEGASKEAEETVTNILVDSWTLTVPGFGEAEDLRRKLGGKLSYAYASGMFKIGMLKPELLPGFEELAKVISQVDDMPVESLVRMGGPASGDLAPSVSSEKSGVVSGALSRLGNMGRKKTNGRQSASADDEQDILVEMTTELSDASAGTTEESKFNVPAGFKQVQPPASKD